MYTITNRNIRSCKTICLNQPEHLRIFHAEVRQHRLFTAQSVQSIQIFFAMFQWPRLHAKWVTVVQLLLRLLHPLNVMFVTHQAVATPSLAWFFLLRFRAAVDSNGNSAPPRSSSNSKQRIRKPMSNTAARTPWQNAEAPNASCKLYTRPLGANHAPHRRCIEGGVQKTSGAVLFSGGYLKTPTIQGSVERSPMF